jgi:sugar/nucleoside kinase (ribokinase family)
MPILIVGHTSIDNIKTINEKKENLLGGAALYSTFSARIFDEDIYILTSIGFDFPEKYFDVIKKLDKGVVIRSKRPTTRFTIEYNDTWHARYDEEKTIHGAGEEITPDLIPEEIWKKIDVIHIATMPPEQQKKFKEEAMKRGIITSIDTYTGYINKDKAKVLDLIKDVDIIWPNKEEAFLLTGIRDSERAAIFLKENFNSKIVCVKREGEGVCIAYEDKIKKINAFKTEVRDPTGAGDCTSGGFLPIFIKTREPIKSILYGMGVAAIKIRNFGADSLLKIEKNEIEKLVKSTPHFF